MRDITAPAEPDDASPTRSTAVPLSRETRAGDQRPMPKSCSMRAKKFFHADNKEAEGRGESLFQGLEQTNQSLERLFQGLERTSAARE